VNRKIHAQLESLDKVALNLKHEKSKLLLEKASFLADARVEQIAREKLGMELPKKTEIIKP
jgi:cell division protein FtsL